MFKYKTNDGKEVVDMIEKYYEQSRRKSNGNSKESNKK